jgi:streptomycin 6-kinase
VLLLERLHEGRDLSAEPLDQARATIGELLRRLNVPADGPFVRVDERARAWAGELAAARRQPPTGVPLRLLETAAHLLPDLLASTKPVLLHTDLHYENVLEADRETWLAIDPKPMVGDAAYEVAPVLWNRWPEATGADHLADHLRRRADGVTEAAAMDRERVAALVVVREAVEALEGHTQHPRHRLAGRIGNHRGSLPAPAGLRLRRVHPKAHRALRFPS